MDLQIAERLMTADELSEHLTDMLAELVEGELIEMPPAGDIHTLLSSFLHYLLYHFVLINKLPGYVTDAQGGYLISENPDTVRAPDVGYILKSRVKQLTGKHIKGAPDLAVEVISPNDRANEVQAKVEEYLSHGTRFVWLVYHKTRVVVVHTPAGSQTLKHMDVLTCAELLPGFSFPISDIFAVLEK